MLTYEEIADRASKVLADTYEMKADAYDLLLRATWAVERIGDERE